MAVLAQCVGTAHHEGRAVQHVAGFKNPGGRCIQGIALEDLAHHHHHQRNNQPGKSFAYPSADAVCCVKQFQSIHIVFIYKCKKTEFCQGQNSVSGSFRSMGN